MPESSNIPLPGAGSRLGQYEIIRQAGAGGMGVVYHARDVDLHREVAIKVLKTVGRKAEDDEAAERFMREARSAARLNHSNVVSVYQVGRQEGLTFIAMEWVEGGNLGEHLRQSVFLEWQEATQAIRDAAMGLAAAHRAGIVHRDLKPTNLMRTADGLVKVVDFGLARARDVASDLTQAGSILGTPAYLSPEQCRGEAATALSDVYALTCTYFHLLTSRPPFDAPSVLGLIQCQLTEPFPDARRFVDEIPDSVLAILERGGRKNPSERYPSCGAMLADLEAVLAGRPVTVNIPASIVKAASVVESPGVATPHNLPHSTTSFVGRQKEIAGARHHLAGNRLVTLIGPGGTGKTRLSLELARGLLAEFVDGVWFVDLATITDEAALTLTIAAAVGVRIEAEKTPIDAVIEQLRSKRVLILLDNCEHVLASAAGASAALLAACAELRIVATSRQALGCAGEVEMRIAALAAPGDEEMPALEELARIESVKLFIDRAAQARPGFSLNAQNAAAIASVCRQLDGIPLAIELAAARIKVLSAEQISQRLVDAFKLLTTGSRTALPRQRTLRAMIDWSFDLLSEEERTVFSRLSVFVGSCALESAEQVAAGDGIEPDAVLDLVAELADKSLLAVEERGGAARYRMLETMRQYAAEKLDARGERGAVEGRHFDHFLALAEEAVPHLTGPEQQTWLARLDLEHDNVRAALDRSPVGEKTMRLSVAIARYWYMRANMAEGLPRLERTLELNPVTGDGSSLYARLLGAAGLMATYFGESTRAQGYLERALAIARAVGDWRTEAATISSLGSLARETGDLPRARELYEQVLKMRRASGETAGLADALNNLAILLSKLPDRIDEAQTLFEESLAIHQRLGNTTWIAFTHLNIGELEHERGDFAAARKRYLQSLGVLEKIGDEWGISYALDGLGKCELMTGNLAAAKDYFERTLKIVRKLGDKRTMADQLDNLAQTALRQGDSSSAWPLARESITLRFEMKDRLGLAQSLDTLAEARHEVDAKRAAVMLGASEEIRTQINAPRTADGRRRHSTLVGSMRQKMGVAEFEAAFESGRLIKPGDPSVLG